MTRLESLVQASLRSTMVCIRRQFLEARATGKRVCFLDIHHLHEVYAWRLIQDELCAELRDEIVAAHDEIQQLVKVTQFEPLQVAA